MRDYKGWTANERLVSLKKTKAAIAAGIIPPPTKCNRCGKETGRIDYHNHDYSDPIKYLEQLCQGCHTRLHRMENKEMDSKNSDQKTIVTPVNEVSENTHSDLNSWLEVGMKLPLEALAEHVLITAAGEKPLWALRGLGIVFCNGYTKDYTCKGYPQKVGIGKNSTKFGIVLNRIIHLEKNGDSLRKKGESLSERLKSNYDNNK